VQYYAQQVSTKVDTCGFLIRRLPALSVIQVSDNSGAEAESGPPLVKSWEIHDRKVDPLARPMNRSSRFIGCDLMADKCEMGPGKKPCTHPTKSTLIFENLANSS
jgi:hypothetical protein